MPLCTFPIHYSTMGTIRKGEQSFRVTNGDEVEVKGIRSFSLELASSFSLHLDDVLLFLVLRETLFQFQH